MFVALLTLTFFAFRHLPKMRSTQLKSLLSWTLWGALLLCVVAALSAGIAYYSLLRPVLPLEEFDARWEMRVLEEAPSFFGWGFIVAFWAGLARVVLASAQRRTGRNL